MLLGGSAVSIHAPVTGATDALIQGGASVKVSIHAPVTGATVSILARIRVFLFQSTRP